MYRSVGKSYVMKSTVLVATWGDGLFAVTGDGRTQEIAKQAVRGPTTDGRGSALAIVGGYSLRRRAPTGEWATVATSEFELSCCTAVRDTIYVGTDDARLLRLSDGSSALDPIDGFDKVAGRDTWFAACWATAGDSLDGCEFEQEHIVRQRSCRRHSAFNGWRTNVAAHHTYQQRSS